MALDNPDLDVVTLKFLENSLRIRGVNDAITGSAQPQITRQSLAGVTLNVPPLAAQKEYENVLKPVREAKTSNGIHLAHLDTLFASLQTRAFAGEL